MTLTPGINSNNRPGNTPPEDHNGPSITAAKKTGRGKWIRGGLAALFTFLALRAWKEDLSPPPPPAPPAPAESKSYTLSSQPYFRATPDLDSDEGILGALIKGGCVRYIEGARDNFAQVEFTENGAKQTGYVTKQSLVPAPHISAKDCRAVLVPVAPPPKPYLVAEYEQAVLSAPGPNSGSTATLATKSCVMVDGTGVQKGYYYVTAESAFGRAADGYIPEGKLIPAPAQYTPEKCWAQFR